MLELASPESENPEGAENTVFRHSLCRPNHAGGEAVLQSKSGMRLGCGVRPRLPNLGIPQLLLPYDNYCEAVGTASLMSAVGYAVSAPQYFLGIS